MYENLLSKFERFPPPPNPFDFRSSYDIKKVYINSNHELIANY